MHSVYLFTSALCYVCVSVLIRCRGLCVACRGDNELRTALIAKMRALQSFEQVGTLDSAVMAERERHEHRAANAAAAC